MAPDSDHRTCRELADLVEQLELPGAGHLPDLGSQFLRGRLDEKLEAQAVAVALCALYICSRCWTLVSASVCLITGAEVCLMSRGGGHAQGRVHVVQPNFRATGSLHQHDEVWYGRVGLTIPRIAEAVGCQDDRLCLWPPDDGECLAQGRPSRASHEGWVDEMREDIAVDLTDCLPACVPSRAARCTRVLVWRRRQFGTVLRHLMWISGSSQQRACWNPPSREDSSSYRDFALSTDAGSRLQCNFR